MGSTQSMQINKNLSLELEQAGMQKLSEDLKNRGRGVKLVAIKNKSSYLISGSWQGLKLVEKGTQIWEHFDQLKGYYTRYKHIKYIPIHNAILSTITMGLSTEKTSPRPTTTKS